MVNQSRTSKTKASNFLPGNVIVSVGAKDQQKQFTISRASIQHRMNILATADENDLYLGKVEELTTIPVAAFSLYHAWLCGKRFTADTIWMESYDTLFHLHPLSHPLHDIEFRDAIFDGIIDKFNSGADNISSCFLLSHATVQLVYADPDKPHPLRALVARMYTKRVHHTHAIFGFPNQFLVDLLHDMLGGGNKDYNFSDKEAAEFRAGQNLMTVVERKTPVSKKRKRTAE